MGEHAFGRGEPRIPPGSWRDIGVANTLIARVLGLAAGTNPPHVFTTLARHRSLFWRWLIFASGLMPGGRMPRADTELTILRVAHLAGCHYEWEHHAKLGRKAGLSAREIEGARSSEATAPFWSARQAAILRAIDVLHERRALDDESWAALSAHLDERELIELCMLVGHYEMLAMTLSSLRVQPDSDRT